MMERGGREDKLLFDSGHRGGGGGGSRVTDSPVVRDDAYYEEVRQAVGRGAPTLLLGTSTRALHAQHGKAQLHNSMRRSRARRSEQSLRKRRNHRESLRRRGHGCPQFSEFQPHYCSKLQSH